MRGPSWSVSLLLYTLEGYLSGNLGACGSAASLLCCLVLHRQKTCWSELHEVFVAAPPYSPTDMALAHVPLSSLNKRIAYLQDVVVNLLVP